MGKDVQSDAGTRKYDVGYMQRTREFYSAQGYTNHYQWAKKHNRTVYSADQATQRLQGGSYYHVDARHRSWQSAARCLRTPQPALS